MIPDTRYARTPDGAYIAYQVVGEGDVDLVWQLDYIGNIDLVWETLTYGDFLRGLASFSRLILHDRRGIGLSSRNVAPGNLETRGADLRAVLNVVRSDRPLVLGGDREGGAPNALLAATDPQLTSALIWWQPMPRCVWAPDYPWGIGPDVVRAFEREEGVWGTADWGTAWLEENALVGDEGHSHEEAAALARLTRHTCTPDVAADLNRVWYETDVRGVLPSVQAPMLLVVDHPDEDSAYIASLLPNVHVAVIPTLDQSSQEALDQGLEAIRRFVGVERTPQGLDSVLSTVLFTDIVNSTELQVAVGDRGWKDLVERHHALVRESLRRWHGVENDTAGDASMRRSMGRREPSGARSRSSITCDPSGSRSEQGCIPGSASWSRASARASPCRSALGWRPAPTPARCSSPRPSRTSSRGAVWGSWTPGSTS